MFTIQLEQIATVDKLKESAFAIKSKAVGLDKHHRSKQSRKHRRHARSFRQRRHLLLLNFQSFLKEILQLLQKWEMPEFRHFPEKLKRSFEKKVGESPFSRFRK